MKKLWIILGFFAVMAGLAVWEIVATTSFYKKTNALLYVLEQRFEQVEEVDDPIALAALDELETHWKSGKKLVRTFGNHTVARGADERMVALGEFTRQNERSDAMVSLRQAQAYIRDLMHDLYPTFTNLL
ncbi:MAG: DUF4363 family protein [Clostridiales bacterium]|nr:DUF4363 family protein [Clostridiales bacterium]